MSDYTPITGELRDVYTQKDAYNIVFHTNDFERFCDAIDAIHAQLEKENAALKAEYEKAVRELNDYAQDSVLLPKDADGQTICEHDKIDWRDHSGKWHENATVMALCADGCYVMYALDGMMVHVHESDIRHHRPDTWERIIEDVRRRTSDYYCNNIPCNFREMTEEMVARCKALCERTNGGDAE